MRDTWHLQLTGSKEMRLRVELESHYGQAAWAEYDTFRWVSYLLCIITLLPTVARLDGEAEDYRLWVGGYSGNASDSLSAHNGFKFSTIDRWDTWHVTRWTRVCVTKKLHVAGIMTRRPTAAPAPRPTEAGGGSTGKLVWLIDILLTPHGFESSTRNMLKKTADSDQYCTPLSLHFHILL